MCVDCSGCWIAVALLVIVVIEGVILVCLNCKNRSIAQSAMAQQDKIFDHAAKVHRMVNDAIGEPPPTISEIRPESPPDSQK